MIIGISGKKQHGKDTVAMIIEYIVDQYKQHGQILQTFDKFKTYWATQVLINPSGYQAHWQTKRFADKVKDIVCLLINCTRAQLEDNEFKEKELGEEWDILINYKGELVTRCNVRDLREERKMTPRLLLQLVGTECGRNIIHPNVWVNALMSEYKPNNNCQQHSDGLYYTDEHGLNEVTPIHPNWIIPDVRFPNEVKAIEDKGGVVIRVNRLFNVPIPDNHESETALDNHTFKYTICNDGSIETLVEMVETTLKHLKIIE